MKSTAVCWLQLSLRESVCSTFNACELIAIEHECTQGWEPGDCEPSTESIVAQIQHLHACKMT